MLRRIVEAAVELVGRRVRCAGRDRRRPGQLTEFIPVGLDAAEIARDPSLAGGPRPARPELITQPRPLRLADIAEHAESSGFPDGHPPMRTLPRRAGPDPRPRVRQPVPDREARRRRVRPRTTRRWSSRSAPRPGVAVENARLYDEAQAAAALAAGQRRDHATALLSGADSGTAVACDLHQAGARAVGRGPGHGSRCRTSSGGG